MTKPTEQLIDGMVRDFCRAGWNVKSETRRRLLELVAAAQKEKGEPEQLIDEGWENGGSWEEEYKRLDINISSIDDETIKDFIRKEIAEAYKKGYEAAREIGLALDKSHRETEKILSDYWERQIAEAIERTREDALKRIEEMMFWGPEGEINVDLRTGKDAELRDSKYDGWDAAKKIIREVLSP